MSKRRDDESYEAYRERLKAEKAVTKEKLRGVFTLTSSAPRHIARGELSRQGPEVRAKIEQAREGAKRRVQSHRKMGG
jgi:hypothetical protein